MRGLFLLLVVLVANLAYGLDTACIHHCRASGKSIPLCVRRCHVEEQEKKSEIPKNDHTVEELEMLEKERERNEELIRKEEAEARKVEAERRKLLAEESKLKSKEEREIKQDEVILSNRAKLRRKKLLDLQHEELAKERELLKNDRVLEEDEKKAHKLEEEENSAKMQEIKERLEEKKLERRLAALKKHKVVEGKHSPDAIEEEIEKLLKEKHQEELKMKNEEGEVNKFARERASVLQQEQLERKKDHQRAFQEEGKERARLNLFDHFTERQREKVMRERSHMTNEERLEQKKQHHFLNEEAHYRRLEAIQKRKERQLDHEEEAKAQVLEREHRTESKELKATLARIKARAKEEHEELERLRERHMLLKKKMLKKKKPVKKYNPKKRFKKWKKNLTCMKACMKEKKVHSLLICRRHCAPKIFKRIRKAWKKRMDMLHKRAFAKAHAWMIHRRVFGATVSKKQEKVNARIHKILFRHVMRATPKKIKRLKKGKKANKAAAKGRVFWKWRSYRKKKAKKLNKKLFKTMKQRRAQPVHPFAAFHPMFPLSKKNMKKWQMLKTHQWTIPHLVKKIMGKKLKKDPHWVARKNKNAHPKKQAKKHGKFIKHHRK